MGRASTGGPREDAYDVVVVGSGLGGISVAALLAHGGLSVLVCEQGQGAGGYAHAFSRGDYTFDSAVRVIAEAEMIEGLLGHLGVADQVELTPMDHLYRAHFPDLEVFAPAGLEEFLEAHIRLFPAEEDGIRTFFGLRRQMFLEAAQLPMQLSPKELDEAVERFPTIFRFRQARLGEVVDTYLHDPRLKALCTALWPYMGSEPSRLSFFAYAQFLGVLVDGPFYCQGSFQRLVDAFVTALTRRGGELLLECPVARITVDDGAVSGVVLEDGRRIRSRAVVSNADAHHTFLDLIGSEQLAPSFVKRLQRMRPSMSAFVIYAATKQDMLAFDPAHETFVYNHWDHAETWKDILRGRPGGMSMSVMTMLDPSLAPPDEHLLIFTSVAAYDIGRPWWEVKEAYTDDLLGQFERHFPGLRDGLTFVQAGTPVTLERYTRNHRGATYGWELVPSQIGSKRTKHRGPLEGLYLSGHWSEEGPASFRAVLSGMNTARMVHDDLGTGVEVPTFKPDDIPPMAL
jgi:phytoene desaturase